MNAGKALLLVLGLPLLSSVHSIKSSPALKGARILEEEIAVNKGSGGSSKGGGKAKCLKNETSYSLKIEYGTDPVAVNSTFYFLLNQFTDDRLTRFEREEEDPYALAGTTREIEGCTPTLPKVCLMYVFGDDTSEGIVKAEIKLEGKKVLMVKNFGIAESGQVGDCTELCQLSGLEETFGLITTPFYIPGPRPSPEPFKLTYFYGNDEPVVFESDSRIIWFNSCAGPGECLYNKWEGANAGYVSAEQVPVYDFFGFSPSPETTYTVCGQDYRARTTMGKTSITNAVGTMRINAGPEEL